MTSLVLTVTVEDYGEQYRALVHDAGGELLGRVVRGSRREAITAAIDQAKEDVADELTHRVNVAARAKQFAAATGLDGERTEDDR